MGFVSGEKGFVLRGKGILWRGEGFGEWKRDFGWEKVGMGGVSL